MEVKKEAVETGEQKGTLGIWSLNFKKYSNSSVTVLGTGCDLVCSMLRLSDHKPVSVLAMSQNLRRVGA